MSLDGALEIARLVRELEEINGRKRLQKIVHLLAANGHTEFPHRFILYYYGPFSRAVATDLDFVCDVKVVNEELKGEKYVYTLGVDDAGSWRLDDVTGAEELPAWTEFAKALNEEDTPFLEALSTLVYLKEAGYKDKELKDEFDRVKPHLKKQFDDASEYANKRKLPKKVAK